jgi:hypothetical protein
MSQLLTCCERNDLARQQRQVRPNVQGTEQRTGSARYCDTKFLVELACMYEGTHIRENAMHDMPVTSKMLSCSTIVLVSLIRFGIISDRAIASLNFCRHCKLIIFTVLWFPLVGLSLRVTYIVFLVLTRLYKSYERT